MPQPMMPSRPGRPEVPGAAAGTPPVPVAPGAGGVVTARPRKSRRARRRRSARELLAAVAGAWPLLVVLAVQAALSVRLLWANTAFQDEATYLWAGHLEWAHWVHGAAIPPFPTFFSGAPVLYPPLGALADSVGGLAGARVLSLVFMLVATALLWAVADRLYGRRAAYFAAALFAVSGPVLHLGAFATYDALAVMLVALAAWCVVRAGNRGEGTAWMIAGGAALAGANAVSYASALFDVVVLALALLTTWPAGPRLAARRCATLLIVVVVALAAGLLAGGKDYLTGIEQTTLARVGAADPVTAVLAAAWSWTGLIVLLAAAGVIISWAGRRGWAATLLLAVLTAAALLGPLEQARLHTLASLNKHVGLGAWFAAIAAGYAIDRFIAAAPEGRAQAVATAALILALVFPASLGASQSWRFSTDWPNATTFIAIFGPLASHGNGHLLVETPSIARYYLPAGQQWQRWSSTRNIIMPSGASTGGPTAAAGVTGPGNRGVFAAFITRGYFSLVALNYSDTTRLDYQLTDDLSNSHHYRIIAVIPYGTENAATRRGTYVIWQHEAQP